MGYLYLMLATPHGILTESPRRVSTTAMDLSNIFIVVDREPCKRQQLSGLELAAKASSS